MRILLFPLPPPCLPIPPPCRCNKDEGARALLLSVYVLYLPLPRGSPSRKAIGSLRIPRRGLRKPVFAMRARSNATKNKVSSLAVSRSSLSLPPLSRSPPPPVSLSFLLTIRVPPLALPPFHLLPFIPPRRSLSRAYAFRSARSPLRSSVGSSGTGRAGRCRLFAARSIRTITVPSLTLYCRSWKIARCPLAIPCNAVSTHVLPPRATLPRLLYVASSFLSLSLYLYHSISLSPSPFLLCCEQKRRATFSLHRRGRRRRCRRTN